MSRSLRAVSAVLLLLGLLALAPPVASGAPTAPAAPGGPSITQRVAVFPPVSATAFGSAFAMDPSRLAVRGRTSGGWVVFVYDRQGDGSWSHAATVQAPAGATSSWGLHLAITGGILVVSDPAVLANNERYGTVHVYRRQGDKTYARTQTILPSFDFTYLARVWAGRDTIVVNFDQYCDDVCSRGRWQLFRRNAAGVYKLVVDSLLDLDPSRGGINLSVGVDLGRFAIGNPSSIFDGTFQPFDNVLTVFDTNPTPIVKTYEKVTPFANATTGEVYHEGWYRKVDLSGTTLAHENFGPSTEKQVVILHQTGSGYARDATFTVPTASNGLAVVPGVVLLADRDRKGWRTYVQRNGAWRAGDLLAAPAGVAGTFAVEPVAAADRIALAGGGRVWVFTVTP